MKYILQTFQRLQKRVQALWKEVEVNISDLGLSFDWRKQDRNASNSSQSFKIFSSSLGKSCCSAAPAAIENESFWPKEQKNRNDDNLGLINRRGFHKRVPERYFHMEAKDIPRCIHRWCNISQKSFPGCDDPKQNGVHLRKKGKWSSDRKRLSLQQVTLGFFWAWDWIIMKWRALKSLCMQAFFRGLSYCLKWPEDHTGTLLTILQTSRLVLLVCPFINTADPDEPPINKPKT